MKTFSSSPCTDLPNAKRTTGTALAALMTAALLGGVLGLFDKASSDAAGAMARAEQAAVPQQTAAAGAQPQGRAAEAAPALLAQRRPAT